MTLRTLPRRSVLFLSLLMLAAVMSVPSTSSAAGTWSATLTGNFSEAQLVTQRGTGEFRLRFGVGGPGVAETGDLPDQASAAQVESALNSLSNISDDGSVSVVFADWPFYDESSYRVTFDGGDLRGKDVPLLRAINGSTPMISLYPGRTLAVEPLDPSGVRKGDERIDYVVGVSNTASNEPVPGGTLVCDPDNAEAGHWFNNPTSFTYQWVRSGVSLGSANGAQTSAYTIQPDDAGHSLQCVVHGANASGGGSAASVRVVVSPSPSPLPPGPGSAKPTLTTGNNTNPKTCNEPTIADTTWTYQWLRNGQPIDPSTNPTATEKVYTPNGDDTFKTLQCQVTGKTGTGGPPGGGTVIGISINTQTSPPGGFPGGLPASGNGALPRASVDSVTSGPVTLTLDLPAGADARNTAFNHPTALSNAVPDGWSCSASESVGNTPARATCTRSDALSPGQSYPGVRIGVVLDPNAPGPSTVTARVEGGGATTATVSDAFETDPNELLFGFMGESFMTDLLDADGSDSTQAGAHPWGASALMRVNTYRKTTNVSGLMTGVFAPRGLIKQLKTDTPPGLVGNALAPPVLCENPRSLSTTEPDCPLASAVGEARYISLGNGQQALGNTWAPKILYAIKPAPGFPAQFAWGDTGVNIVGILNARLRPDDGYAISVDTAPLPASMRFMGLGATICSYGAELATPHSDGYGFKGCKKPGDPGAWSKPLLTNPTACTSSPLQTRMSADSWENPGVFSSITTDEPPMTGCDIVPFTPSSVIEPHESSAGGPAGLDAVITVPSDGLEDPNGISQSHLKKTVVELPEGVSVNPSGATGLTACSDDQLALKTDIEPSCPDASKIGTVDIDTPILEEHVGGDLVLRSPKSTDPESGDMLRLAIIARNEERGILVKLPGSATADPSTGKLAATFDDNPQLPFSDLKVKLKGGERGMLANPQRCGTMSTKTTLTPWSGNSAVEQIAETPVDGDCEERFAPKLEAGSSDSKARGHGVFSFKFTREQGEQWIDGLTAELPTGLLASVKDVPLCPAAQAESGACPEGSRIGAVDATAGAGNPFVLEKKGSAYLTEGYKGCAYGLAVTVPVIAGPFDGKTPETDLGTIVVRQAVCVDPGDAHVTVKSDPLPTIHKGIPLRVRSVTVSVDRERFMLNPSDCSAKSTDATFFSPGGASASASSPFQASDCAALPFRPKLALRLVGKRQVTTGKHPGIKAVVTQAGTAEAGIEQAVVRLPKSLALDPNNAQALCEFEDGTKPDLENRCPKGSIVGRARAKTPLLRNDLVGNVYFVKNIRRDPVTGNEIRTLPMIVVALRGEIAINLKGESSTTKSGKLVNTFASVPDAPISQFNLNIVGGKTGIIAVTRTRKAKINLCTGRHTAEADMDAQNGRRHDTDVRMKTPCTKRQVKKAKRAAAKAKRG